MHIKVTGKHIDIGDSLRTHVEERLNAAVGKYFDRTVDATVTFSRVAHTFRGDLSVHLATGMTAQSQGDADEIYACFEMACDRVEKQLRRYKRRLKNHHHERPEPIEAMEAPSYVLASSDEEPEHEPESLQPIIIAEMKTPIKSLTVGEAVMQMELSDSSFLIFKNQGNARLNVVYRRDDGNIGWVDPANMAESRG